MGHGNRTEMLAFLGIFTAALAASAQVTQTSDATPASVLTTSPTTGRTLAGDAVVSAFPADARSQVAFLGVLTSAPQTALQKQLQLKPGVGLVVDSVTPASPAEKAGIKQYDILHKLDDQLLINAEQLDVLVRTLGAGHAVKLAVIREGKPTVLNARLEARAAEAFRWGRPAMASQALPPSSYVSRRRTPVAYFNDQPEVIRIKDPNSLSQISAAQITIDDGRRKMTISTRDRQRHLKAEDNAGKLLFEGLIHTKEQFEKIPPELRDVLKEILLDDDAAPASPSTKPAAAVNELSTKRVTK